MWLFSIPGINVNHLDTNTLQFRPFIPSVFKRNMKRFNVSLSHSDTLVLVCRRVCDVDTFWTSVTRVRGSEVLMHMLLSALSSVLYLSHVFSFFLFFFSSTTFSSMLPANACRCVCLTTSDVVWCIRHFSCLGVKNPIRANGMADRYLTGSRLMVCVSARVRVCVWRSFNTSQRWISARQHGDTVRKG